MSQLTLLIAKSIKAMFEKVGNFDAIVCVAGEAKWAGFNELTEKIIYRVKKQIDGTSKSCAYRSTLFE